MLRHPPIALMNEVFFETFDTYSIFSGLSGLWITILRDVLPDIWANWFVWFDRSSGRGVEGTDAKQCKSIRFNDDPSIFKLFAKFKLFGIGVGLPSMHMILWGVQLAFCDDINFESKVLLGSHMIVKTDMTMYFSFVVFFKLRASSNFGQGVANPPCQLTNFFQ